MGLLESGRRLLRRGFRLPAKPRIPEVVYRASSQPVSRAEASRRKILLKIPLLSLGRRFVETRDAFLYLVRFLLKMGNHRPIGAKARSIEETKETGRKGKDGFAHRHLLLLLLRVNYTLQNLDPLDHRRFVSIERILPSEKKITEINKFRFLRTYWLKDGYVWLSIFYFTLQDRNTESEDPSIRLCGAKSRRQNNVFFDPTLVFRSRFLYHSNTPGMYLSINFS